MRIHKKAYIQLTWILLMSGVAGLVAWVTGLGLPVHAGLSLPMWSLVIAFGLQWLMFIHAYLKQTERYYDLTGALSNSAIVLLCLCVSVATARNYLLASLILIWAVRLGGFLFWRVSVDGGDARFDRIKIDFYRFLATWTLQAMWIFLILLCAILAMASGIDKPLGWLAVLGVGCWILGFALEVVADLQKRLFRVKPANAGKFIHSGLWAWSRHPNYFGEILVWIGVSIIALPVLSGWQYFGLLSPLFVILVLTKVSGIPLLEASANRRWGGDPIYEHYKARTPVLVPRRPRS